MALSLCALSHQCLGTSGSARTSRQPGHFQVSTVSQGASQGRSFLARAFDLARPGVAPLLLGTGVLRGGGKVRGASLRGGKM